MTTHLQSRGTAEKVDFRALMKKMGVVAAAIEPHENLDLMVVQIAQEVITRFRDELGIFGGRVYRREGGSYDLEAAIPEDRRPDGALSVHASYPPIEELLDRRIIYVDRDDPRLDQDLEEALGTREFAAIEVGDEAYILAFDIEPDRNRDDVLVSLGILRYTINQKLRQEQLEGAMREARRIQVSILPRRIPVFEDFDLAGRSEAMEIVGGDYFDFLPISDKILGTAVADVSGHGLPAALLVRDVRMGLHMGMSRDFKIVKTLERLNRIIHESKLTSRFVSVFYGELGRSGGYIYVNAGHPPPICLSGEGRVGTLSEGGPVVGPLPDASYEAGFVRLEPGDLVIAYTDGIIEAENPKDEQFGFDRLVDTCRRYRDEPSDQIIAAVFDAVESFTGTEPPHDDRTVLVVKYPK
jgi:sigma-B regulation protein RsbU (phosphoserine phosphatase)